MAEFTVVFEVDGSSHERKIEADSYSAVYMMLIEDVFNWQHCNPKHIDIKVSRG